MIRAQHVRVIASRLVIAAERKPIKLKAAVVFQGAEEWRTFTTLAKTFDSITSSSAGTDAMKKTYTSAAEMSKDVKEVIQFFGGACYSEVGKKLLDNFSEMLEDQVSLGFPAK